MHDFKVGDRVTYVGPSHDIQKLSPFIINAFYGSGNTQYVKIKGVERYEPMVSNLRHVAPAPDVITINRTDLPPVSAEYEASDFPGKDAPRVALAVLLAAGWSSADDAVKSLRSVINGYEHSIALDAAASAEKEAKSKLNKRRDELAKEVAKRACYVNYQDFTYEDHVSAAQAAINMFIELEDPRG